MTIEKLNTITPDLTKQNIARLTELFPECVTEGPGGTASDRGEPVVDFDLLQQALSDHLVEGPQERYRLDWPGKRQALLTANAPIDKTLRPMRDESVNFDATRNLFIEGDNLDALKLLQETYLGKVKMIYIDPPYNTGNDFIYDDNFAQSRQEFETDTGLRDEEGGRLVANPPTNGRFHSDWLSMMYARLKLARNLLRDDGLLFISIDEGEVFNLKHVCDELFGARSFIEMIAWKNKYGSGALTTGFANVHEYILVYSKGADLNLSAPLTGEQKEAYRNRDDKFSKRGGYITQPLMTKSKDDRPNLIYPLVHNGEEIWPDKQWIWAKDRLQAAYDAGEVVVNKTGDKFSVRSKQYLYDERGMLRRGKPISLLLGPFNQEGTAEIDELFGERVFDFPKPTKLLTYLFSLSTSQDDEDDQLILDFFAGAGTAAHAAMLLSSADGRKRRTISVQLPATIEPNETAAKAGYTSISEVARERIRRAGAKILKENGELRGTLDVGFRAFRIDSGNIVDTRVTPQQASQDALAGMISHIKDGRTDEDLLFGALLRWGVDITLLVEKRELTGRTIWLVDPPADGAEGAALVACFARPHQGKGGIDTELADAIARMKPLRVLFRDDGFTSDAIMENVQSRFKQLAPDTDVKVL
jgi:adenine-specific DNA-methyltransferase